MGYSAADAFPISGYGDWNLWQSNMLRGVGGNIPRFNNAPVRIAEPPPEGKNTIFQIQEQLENSHFDEV